MKTVKNADDGSGICFVVLFRAKYLGCSVKFITVDENCCKMLKSPQHVAKLFVLLKLNRLFISNLTLTWWLNREVVFVMSLKSLIFFYIAKQVVCFICKKHSKLPTSISWQQKQKLIFPKSMQKKIVFKLMPCSMLQNTN